MTFVSGLLTSRYYLISRIILPSRFGWKKGAIKHYDASHDNKISLSELPSPTMHLDWF
uniref:Calcium-binding EF-hand n=1 Tax=Medicago truncatula TaxID=3880 RepID=Q2HSS6_MEDTR|nr:Calcium-binding EF-hand [Medicago truncatula]